MVEFLEFDSNYNKSEGYLKKLPKSERDILNDFEKYSLISAGKDRARKSKVNALRFLVMTKKKLNNINLKDLQEFLRILKQSDLSDYFKNDIKGFVQRFLKWNFKDWSERFNNFEDLKFNGDAQRSKKIDPEDVLSPKDIGKLVKGEPSLYWKTFIIVQYEGALRTLETRQLKWGDIDKNDKDVYWLNVGSKKNKNGTIKERTSPPLDKAIYFLDELKKQSKSPYVFPSIESPNNFISSGTVSKWFSRLTKRVLGKSRTNYILRHSRGEEFHKLVREGRLSKENALNMMGHSEKMFDKTYSHADKEQMKSVLKKQVLDIDYIPPEKKNKLEREIEEQKKTIDKLWKSNKAMGQSLADFGSELLEIREHIKSKK